MINRVFGWAAILAIGLQLGGCLTTMVRSRLTPFRNLTVRRGVASTDRRRS